uniref:Putative secreted protein n=1 Tax=Lutzomyia longipalpis TaxID=7200 RepID=A0A7G3AP06_LUTLO
MLLVAPTLLWCPIHGIFCPLLRWIHLRVHLHVIYLFLQLIQHINARECSIITHGHRLPFGWWLWCCHLLLTNTQTHVIPHTWLTLQITQFQTIPSIPQRCIPRRPC